MKKNFNIIEKKWLFLLSYAPGHKAGAGLSTMEFARFLTKKGIQASILTLNRMCREKPYEITGGVPVHRIPYLNQNMLTKLFSMIWIQAWYLVYCLKSRVVFIIGGKTIGLEVMLFWCWLFGRKVVFRSTNQGVDDMHSIMNTNSFFRSIRKFLFSKIRVYYSLHPVFTEIFRTYFPSGPRVFESVQGVNLQRFFRVTNDEKTKIRSKLGLPENTLLFITLGVLTYRKGFPELIGCLSNFDRDFLWIVLGEKDFGKNHFLQHKMPESLEIQRLGKEKLGKKITFRGWDKQPEKYLQAGDVFILGGTREGIPNACLQAMACGLPVIARNNPGFYEMLGAGNNAILLFEKEKDFLNTIDKLISDRNFYHTVSENAVEFAQNHFSYDGVLSGLINRLEEKS